MPRIEADLRLAVTAPDGRSTTAQVVGDGSTLRVESPRPDVLLAAIDRTDVGPLADALDAAGISVSVSGPDGRVATIGSAAASSRVGRLLTGSANTEFRVRDVLPRGAGPIAVSAAAALVVLLIRVTRSRRAG